MKVKELIEQLSRCNPHADVGVEMLVSEGTGVERDAAEITCVEWAISSEAEPVLIITEPYLVPVHRTPPSCNAVIAMENQRQSQAAVNIAAVS